jgi:hypothetical protein
MSARGVSPEQRRQRADNFKVFFAIGEAAAFCLRLFTLDTEADWPLRGVEVHGLRCICRAL